MIVTLVRAATSTSPAQTPAAKLVGTEATRTAGGGTARSRRDLSTRRLPPQAATTAFKKIARLAGSLHSVPHSAATHLLASGVDVATTAGVLEHANASVTLNVYGHILGDGLRSATDRFGARLKDSRCRLMATEWQPSTKSYEKTLTP
jgi:integrase